MLKGLERVSKIRLNEISDAARLLRADQAVDIFGVRAVESERLVDSVERAREITGFPQDVSEVDLRRCGILAAARLARQAQNERAILRRPNIFAAEIGLVNVLEELFAQVGAGKAGSAARMTSSCSAGFLRARVSR